MSPNTAWNEMQLVASDPESFAFTPVVPRIVVAIFKLFFALFFEKT